MKIALLAFLLIVVLYFQFFYDIGGMVEKNELLNPSEPAGENVDQFPDGAQPDAAPAEDTAIP
jgi:hypothetical protein